MNRALHAAIAMALAALAAGCVTPQSYSAAGDVHALMVSIRDDDQPAFDAHVDRRALEAQIQARIVARADRPGSPEMVKGLGVLLSGPLARAAGGVLIQPEVFRAVADYYGYKPGAPLPGRFAIAGALKSLPDGRVCAVMRRGGACLVTFASEEGTWRLVSFDGEAAMLRMRGR